MAKKINTKRVSLLDEIEKNEVFIPESIQHDVEQQIVNNQQKFDKSLRIKDLLAGVKSKDTSKIQEKIELETDVLVQPEEIDIVEKAVNDIPNIDFNDEFVIEPTTKTRKNYTRYKITIKGGPRNVEFAKMLSELKKMSDGKIVHRKCDVRSIGITNDNQLKNSDVKLLKYSYTVKPLGGIVNKSTRIIVSFDAQNLDAIIIYMQKGRDKFIHQFNVTTNEEWDYIRDWIYDFYETLNFKLAKYKLVNRSYDTSPIYQTIKNLAKTRKFAVTLPNDIDSLERFKFKPINGLNTHLIFNVVKDTTKNGGGFSMEPTFKVIVTSDIDKKLYLNLSAKSEFGNKVNFTLAQLNTDKFYKAVDMFCKSFDNEVYNIDDINYNKLSKLASKRAYNRLLQVDESKNLVIRKVLNSDETRTELIENGYNPKKDYDAENIVFTMDGLVYGILQYSAISGDRDKRGYLTRKYKFKLMYQLENGDNETEISTDLDKLLSVIGI